MKKSKNVFPLFISLEGKKILIVGAGKVAARRADILLSFSACLCIVAPEFSEEMERVLQQKTFAVSVRRQRRCFKKADLEGMDMVLAATDDEELNHQITELCRQKNIVVNNASCQEDCDFFFPAVIQTKGLTIGVSSGGSDHKRVAMIAAKIREFLKG